MTDEGRDHPSEGPSTPVRGPSEWHRPPTALDWHCWMPCNLSCKFCFKTWEGFLPTLPAGSGASLSRTEARTVISLLRGAGFEKLTLAGGEPTLHPFLPEILAWAKEEGLTAMLVTNGHFLTDAYLSRIERAIDAVKISIDSPSEDTQLALGRGHGGHVAKATLAALRVKAHGVPLMLNTVVTAKNWDEDMTELLRKLSPVRWKVFQALPERGENDGFRDWCTDEQFQAFLARHSAFSPTPEDNRLMRGSYVMLDAIGRFMQDTTGQYSYSDSILKVGVMNALLQVGWDSLKFEARGGLYSWKRGQLTGREHGLDQ